MAEADANAPGEMAGGMHPLKSKQWSCATLDRGLDDVLARAKEELPDDDAELRARAEETLLIEKNVFDLFSKHALKTRVEHGGYFFRSSGQSLRWFNQLHPKMTLCLH